MSKADRKVRLERRDAQVKLTEGRQMMMRAADAIERQNEAIQRSEASRDFLRNLLVACAWDSVTGMERPLSEVVRENAPQLMGIIGAVPNRRDAEALAGL